MFLDEADDALEATAAAAPAPPPAPHVSASRSGPGACILYLSAAVETPLTRAFPVNAGVRGGESTRARMLIVSHAMCDI